MRRKFDAVCRQYEVKEAGMENLWTTDRTWPTSSGALYDATTQTYTVPPDKYISHYVYTLPTPIPAGTTVTITVFFDSGYCVNNGGTYFSIGCYSNSDWESTVRCPVGVDLVGSIYTNTKKIANPITKLAITTKSVTVFRPLKFRVMLTIGYIPAHTFKPFGVGKNAWPDGLKSGFPSVKMLGKTEQQSFTGKNLFNMLTLKEDELPTNITSVGEGEIVITTPDSYNGNGYATTGLPLREFAPSMTVGETYSVSFKTDSPSNNRIYLQGSNLVWRPGNPSVLTEADLNSIVAFYGLASNAGEGTGNCRISNFQIERGTAATAYEPYVGGIPSPSPQYPQEIKANNATVRSLGKNWANAFIDNEQYRHSTAKIAENVFRVTRADPNNPNGYGQIKIENLPINRALQLVITWQRESTMIEGSNPVVRVWKDANAGGSYGAIYFLDNDTSPYTRSMNFTTQTGYAYLGIYPSAAENDGSVTVQVSVYDANVASLEHIPYFDGGEATAPNLMCAVDGSCQSTYDPQTGELVNWWDKLTFDGSDDEVWHILNHSFNGITYKGFAGYHTSLEKATYRACWCNQAEPHPHGAVYVTTDKPIVCPGAGFIEVYNFGFYDKELKDGGIANWRAYLAEHPLEVWVERNEPEVTNIGAQRMTCPTGYGQIVQVAGDIEDCPLEIKYLTHGGNVK